MSSETMPSDTPEATTRGDRERAAQFLDLDPAPPNTREAFVYGHWLDTGEMDEVWWFHPHAEDLSELLASTRATAARQAREEAIEACAWAAKKEAMRTRHQAAENPGIAEDLMLQAEAIDGAESAIRALAAKGAGK